MKKLKLKKITVANFKNIIPKSIADTTSCSECTIDCTIGKKCEE